MFSQQYSTFNYSTPMGYTENLWDQNYNNYQEHYPTNYQVTPQNIYYSPEISEIYYCQGIQASGSPDSLNQREEHVNYNIPRREVMPPALDEDQNNGNYSFNDPSASFNHTNLIQYSATRPEKVFKPNLNVPMPHRNSNFMGKKHRAQISVVPTQAGKYKAIVKRKRKRTVFTTEQIATLEDTFTTRPYITREQRQVLVDKLQISDKSIKIWFQNRRLKGKKVPEQDTEVNDATSVEEITTSEMSRLDYIQSEIIKKTDEFGFVTLDDRVMGNLADVIDSFLTNDNIVNEEQTQQSSPVYEPISPASVSIGSTEEDSLSWTPSEPNESLQRLFDLQSIISL